MNDGLARSASFVIPIAAAFYFFLNACTQGLVSPTADLDQAQQLILSQDMAWGYGAQPPLYTWIVHLLFSLTGPRLDVLLGMKAALLSALMLGAHQVTRQLELDGPRQRIALLGFAFIPQIVWEAQRDLTHSVLATVMGMWTLWAFLRLRHESGIYNYILLGVSIALGVLSKYNYLLFFLALLMAGIAAPTYRSRILSRGMLLSVLVAIFVLSPHLAWILAHPDMASASAHKFKMVNGLPLQGLVSLIAALLAFSAPLLLVAALSRSKQVAPRQPTEEQGLLGRLLWAVILLLALSVLVSGTTYAKDRWLQPLLFFLPIYIATFLAINARIFSVTAVALLTLVSVMLPGRTLLAEWSGKTSRPNMPYAAAFEKIRTETGKIGMVVSDGELLAGNARLAFPESRIAVVRSPQESESLARVVAGQDILFVSTGASDRGWFERMALEAGREQSTMRVSEAPLLYFPEQTLRMNWLMIRNYPSGHFQ